MFIMLVFYVNMVSFDNFYFFSFAYELPEFPLHVLKKGKEGFRLNLDFVNIL